MMRKLGYVVVSTVVAVGMLMSVALADIFSGQVQSVDADNGSLTIMTEDEGPKQFSAVPSELLQGVKPGHDIDVEVIDGKVQSLQNYSSGN